MKHQHRADVSRVRTPALVVVACVVLLFVVDNASKDVDKNIDTGDMRPAMASLVLIAIGAGAFFVCTRAAVAVGTRASGTWWAVALGAWAIPFLVLSLRS